MLTTFTLLWVVIVGALAGSLGKMILPGNRPSGIRLTILLGVAGGLVGALVALVLGVRTDSYLGIVIEAVAAMLAVFAPSWIVAGWRLGRRAG